MPIVGQFGSLAGLGSLILPGGVMESIATVTVGSGGASSIEFTSIPGSFQHLQLRAILRTDRTGTSGDYIQATFNGATSGYAFHQLYGTGAAATAYGQATQANIDLDRAASSASNSSVFGAFVIEVLDYASTSKATTLRALGGMDDNGSGIVSLGSGLWTTTDAVTSIKLQTGAGSNFTQHSAAALYGVRA